jgi:hypothetical protein
MAAKTAQSSYKSITGQSQKPHDDSRAHQLDKILHSLDEVNFDPSSFAFSESEDNDHETHLIHWQNSKARKKLSSKLILCAQIFPQSLLYVHFFGNEET